MSGFEALTAAWQQGRIMPLTGPTSQERQALAAAIGPTGLADLERRWGPGVVLGSGGSTGERRWCLQPLTHLRRSAEATGRWLGAIGIEPSRCLHLNPLPSHHVSGLLPPLRAELWGAAHQVLPPVLLRDPAALAATVKLPAGRPVLLSLVPTQLRRLMARPEGLAWLRRLAVIWVGGAPLPSDLALSARRAGLPLAPCYGATETAAMVCALPPDRFLAGVAGCGQPLADVRLRLDAASGAVELQTDRLSPGWLVAGMLQPLPRCEDGCGAAAMPGGWQRLVWTWSAGWTGRSTAAAKLCSPSSWNNGSGCRQGRQACRCRPCCCCRWMTVNGASGWWPWCGRRPPLARVCWSGWSLSPPPGRQRSVRSAGCSAPTWLPIRSANGNGTVGGSGLWS